MTVAASLRAVLLRLPTVALVAVVQFFVATPASADEEGCDITSSPSSCVEATEGSIEVGVSERRSRTAPISDRSLSRESSRQQFTLQMGAAFCADAGANAAASGGTSPEIAALCRGFAPLPVAPSRDQVRRAFRELPLYRGQIRTDPAVSTLVNLETYFWCGDAAGRDCATLGEGERSITLLGQRVRIRPRIVDYAWDFGDGAGQRVTSGRAAHTYRHADPVEITLTLTWTADYALAGGSFQPIDDTTTTTSPPRTLPVREAQAIIVGGG